MSEELKPFRCGCGGEAEVYTQPLLGCYVICRNCGMRTRLFINRAEAIEAWNRAMGATDTNVGDKERTAKVEKVDTNSPHSQVYKCCECGQYTHRTAWSRDVHYCPSCGVRLEWE